MSLKQRYFVHDFILSYIGSYYYMFTFVSSILLLSVPKQQSFPKSLAPFFFQVPPQPLVHWLRIVRWQVFFAHLWAKCHFFLSVFDIHVQRATVTGKTGDIFYNKGTFLFANNPAADKNERNLIQLFKDGDPERFAHVEQITGAIARRIECWVKPQQDIKAGEHLGLVRFGSQVAVYMPKDKVRVMVKEGQKVQGGITVLALWK